MKITLKPIDQQVFVITGASSGIGLSTARTAAMKGARVVAAARSVGKLRHLVDQLSANGFQAIAVKADVTDCLEVQNIAREAIENFGRIDTWVNNAGMSIYGRLDEVEEHLRHRGPAEVQRLLALPVHVQVLLDACHIDPLSVPRRQMSKSSSWGCRMP